VDGGFWKELVQLSARSGGYFVHAVAVDVVALRSDVELALSSSELAEKFKSRRISSHVSITRYTALPKNQNQIQNEMKQFICAWTVYSFISIQDVESLNSPRQLSPYHFHPSP